MKYKFWLFVIIIVGFLTTPGEILSKQQTQMPLKYYTPFKEVARGKYSTLYKRTISTYGSHRNSYVRGHKHAGIDLKGKIGAEVFAVAKGEVVAIQLSFPNQSVVVKHTLSKSPPVFSRYTHVEGVLVKVGDRIDQNTCIARLFNKEEYAKSKFGVNHLHLEIRKSILDDCSASWASLTMVELNKYCFDPLVFLKQVMD